MHLIIGVIFILASFKWGDWGKWREYYPTILFFIVGDLLYNFLLADYPMWIFQPSQLEVNILPNHTLVSLYTMITYYPASIIIFLYKFPYHQHHLKKLGYILAWSIFYILLEFVEYTIADTISYQHNWNIGWSFLFNILMFVILAIHHLHPRRALAISFFVIVGLCLLFQVPVSNMR